MGKLERTQDRTLELLADVGEGLRRKLPDKAVQWVETGAALGALRVGSKVAGKFVRRNPVLVGAAVVGAGLLWLAARQRAKRKETIEGEAKQVRALRRGDYERDDYGV